MWTSTSASGPIARIAGVVDRTVVGYGSIRPRRCPSHRRHASCTDGRCGHSLDGRDLPGQYPGGPGTGAAGAHGHGDFPPPCRGPTGRAHDLLGRLRPPGRSLGLGPTARSGSSDIYCYTIPAGNWTHHLCVSGRLWGARITSRPCTWGPRCHHPSYRPNICCACGKYDRAVADSHRIALQREHSSRRHFGASGSLLGRTHAFA